MNLRGLVCSVSTLAGGLVNQVRGFMNTHSTLLKQILRLHFSPMCLLFFLNFFDVIFVMVFLCICFEDPVCEMHMKFKIIIKLCLQW